MTRGLRANLLPLVLLALLPVVLFPGVVAGRRIFGDGDNRGVHFPHKLLMARELSEGDFPIWSRFTGSGYPILAESQAGVLYPPHLLFFWLLPTPTAFNVCILLHVALAACGAFLFARRLGAGNGPALLAGIAYVLQGAYADKLLMAQLLEPRSLIPYAFLLTEIAASAATTLGAIRAATGLGAVIALELLAGSAQDAYFTALYVTLYLCVRSIRRAPVLVLSALEAALLAAPQILTTRELTTMTNRAAGLAALLTQSKYRFGPELLFWIFPYTHPGSATFVAQGFVGIAAYTLAIIAIASVIGRTAADGRRSAIAALAALAALAIPFSLGASSSLNRLFVYIPGVAYFRLPHRSLIFFALAVISLAALGLEGVREGLACTGAARYTGRAMAALSATGAIVTGVQVVRMLHADPVPRALTVTAFLFACVASSVAAVAFGFVRAPGIRRVAASVVALASLFELLVMFRTEDATVPMDDLLTISSSGQWLAVQPGPFRINIEAVRMTPLPAKSVGENPYKRPKDPDALPDKLPGPKLIRWGDVANTSSPTSMRIASYVALLTKIETARPLSGRTAFRGNAALLGLFNVKYILFARPVEDPDLRLVQESTYKVYENLRALPRAFFAPRAMVVKEKDEQAAVLALQDPGHTLVLREGDGEPALQGDAHGTVELDAVSLRSRRIRLHVSSDGPGFVYYSEQHYPGWHAMLDGKPVPLLHADVCFMAVRVEAGEHDVELTFHQNGLLAGVVLSALGVTALGILARRRREASA